MKQATAERILRIYVELGIQRTEVGSLLAHDLNEAEKQLLDDAHREITQVRIALTAATMCSPRTP